MIRPKHAFRAIPFLALPLAFLQPAAALSPQQCYQRDSGCTQMCGNVKDMTWRYECFSRCDIYLDNCLSRGVWTDQAQSLDTSGGGSTPPTPPLTQTVPNLNGAVLSPD
jgi:hypothetical protein